MTEIEDIMKGFDKAHRSDTLELGGEKYYSTYAAARKLGISCGSWYRYLKRFSFKGKQIGQRKYYHESELLKVLDEKGK